MTRYSFPNHRCRFWGLIVLMASCFLWCSCEKSGNNTPSRSSIGPGGRSKPSKYFTDPKVCALADAAGVGDCAEIDRLVDNGVDINATGDKGATPLLWAMRAHNHGGFLRLLERGADPNRQHKELDIGAGSSVTSIAASNKHDPFYLEAALKHGANPNLAELHDGFTPLHYAISSRKIENLNLLIRAGADLNQKYDDYFGETPLLDAAGATWYEGVYRLLETGADYRLTTNDGIELADYVVAEPRDYTGDIRYWKDKVVKFLEEKDVDLEAARKRAEAKGIKTRRKRD